MSNLKTIQKYINKTVKEAVGDKIIELIAKGIFTEIIKESMESTLKEYNLYVNNNTYQDVDPGATLDYEVEPEYEQRPLPIASTEKSEEEQLKEQFTRLAFPDDKTLVAAGQMSQAQKEMSDRKATTILAEMKQQEQKNKTQPTDVIKIKKPNAHQYNTVQESKLTGGSNDVDGIELPEGSVNPAHLLAQIDRNKDRLQQSLQFDNVKDPDMADQINEQQIMNFING